MPPSPVKSRDDSAAKKNERETNTNRPSPITVSRSTRSTTKIKVETPDKKGRIDFNPPQSQVTRTSPTHNTTTTRQATSSNTTTPISSPFASSNRGRGHRGTPLSNRSLNDSVERAARDAAAYQIHGDTSFLHRPSQQQQSTLSRSDTPYAHSNTEKINTMGYQTTNLTSHFGTSGEEDEGFLLGPVGSFAEDSPPRSRLYDDKTNTGRRNSPQRESYIHQHPPQPQHYSYHPGHPSLHDPKSGQQQQQVPSYTHPPYGSINPSVAAYPQQYQYPMFGYQPHGYAPTGYHPTYYHQQAAPPPPQYDQSQLSQSQYSNKDLQKSPSTPIDWGSPPGISFSDSFGFQDSHRKENKISGNIFAENRGSTSSESSVATPDKKSSSKSRGGNPFRSPHSGSKSGSLKSPLFQSSPNLSFNITDTPVGNVATDFSPMGPSFSNFADDDLGCSGDEITTFGGVGSSVGRHNNNRLSLNRSSSSTEEEQNQHFFSRIPPKIKQRPSSSLTSTLEKSPFSNLLLDELSPFPKMSSSTISPFIGSGGSNLKSSNNNNNTESSTSSLTTSALQGVPRSPVVQSGARTGGAKNLPPSPRMPQTSSNVVSTARRTGPGHNNLSIRASPVAPSSEVKPRTLWQQNTGNIMRLTLGHGGSLNSSSQQKSLADINSVMRAQSDTIHSANRASGMSASSTSVSSHQVVYGSHPHPPPPPSMSQGYYHGQMPQHYQTQQHQHHHSLATPMRGSNMGIYGSQQQFDNTGTKQRPQLYSQHPQQRPGSPTSMLKKPPPPIVASGGKENIKSIVSVTPSTQEKKGVCNCKKSKCLKLYCDCFAAKQYCSGCNCNDCYNIPEYEIERDKAIKQAISKNRTAFEPRIAIEHNMGCKCRRSHCLKKYCECFQAGVLCSARCKCGDCLNHADSQKLIDVRRKMKDKKGADFAMRINHETWKKGSTQQQSHSHLPPMSYRPPPGASGSFALPPRGHPSGNVPQYSRPPYLGPPMMGAIVYSPMNVNTVTPGFSNPRTVLRQQSPTPTMMTTKTPAISSSKAPPPIRAAAEATTAVATNVSLDIPVSQKKRPSIEISPSALKSPPISTLSSIEDTPRRSSQEISTPSLVKSVISSKTSSDIAVIQMQPLNKMSPTISKQTSIVDSQARVPSELHDSKKRQSNEMSFSVSQTMKYPKLSDAISVRKKKRKFDDAEEETFPFFGQENPKQPKTVACVIFSFLTNNDKYNASLTCKMWNELLL